jgi:hypothetical protein
MKFLRTATLAFALVLLSVLLPPSSAHAQSWACRNLGIGCPQSIPGTRVCHQLSQMTEAAR